MTRLRDVEWAALNAALADVVAGVDRLEVGDAAVRGCRDGIGASSVAAWLHGPADGPEVLGAHGARLDPPPQPDRRRSQDGAVGWTEAHDGSVTCQVAVETDPGSGNTLVLAARFGIDEYPGPMRREMLKLMATTTAAAIGRLELSDTGRRIALVLQRRLLPRLEPVTTGDAAVRYVPAGDGAKVGGDWYDVVQTRDGRTVLVLGDVVGHSVESAVQMCEISTALRSHLIEGLPATLALARVNDLLINRGGYATCCCIELGPQGTVIVSAGHPPPLRVDGHGDASACDVTPGPPLGAVAGSTYTGQRCELATGDAFVLYSDGLVETTTATITEGIDRLCRAAANAHTDDLEELVTHLLGLAAPLDDLRDDIAILAFRPVEQILELEHGFEDRAARVPTGELPIDSELVWRLIDANPDALLVVASDGEIVLANGRTETIFGHSRSELIGQPVEMLLPDGHGDRHARLRQDFIWNPSTRAMGSGARFSARHCDGTTIDVNVSLSPVELDGDTYVMATVRPDGRSPADMAGDVTAYLHPHAPAETDSGALTAGE